jgi:hypothetical protein
VVKKWAGFARFRKLASLHGAPFGRGGFNRQPQTWFSSNSIGDHQGFRGMGLDLHAPTAPRTTLLAGNRSPRTGNMLLDSQLELFIGGQHGIPKFVQVAQLKLPLPQESLGLQYRDHRFWHMLARNRYTTHIVDPIRKCLPAP